MTWGFAAPIIGDSLFSRSQLAEPINEVTAVPKDRLFLHSSEVSFLVSFRLVYACPPQLTHGISEV